MPLLQIFLLDLEASTIFLGCLRLFEMQAPHHLQHRGTWCSHPGKCSLAAAPCWPWARDPFKRSWLTMGSESLGRVINNGPLGLIWPRWGCLILANIDLAYGQQWSIIKIIVSSRSHWLRMVVKPGQKWCTPPITQDLSHRLGDTAGC